MRSPMCKLRMDQQPRSWKLKCKDFGVVESFEIFWTHFWLLKTNSSATVFITKLSEKGVNLTIVKFDRLSRCVKSTLQTQRLWRCRRLWRHFQSTTCCKQFSYNFQSCYSTWRIYWWCRYLPGLRTRWLSTRRRSQLTCMHFFSTGIWRGLSIHCLSSPQATSRNAASRPSVA